MIEQIKNEILQLEVEQDIKILYAVESGSRAWGFASQDSDWDVRYIYIHNIDWYLQIYNGKDSLERILPNDIDLAGWELKKALRLFRKSNPPLLEWLRSPIIYYQRTNAAEKLRELSKVYFNARSCLHHYLHMAEGNYREYLQRDYVRVKKYFYVLRPILACEWIKRTGNMAPMEFDQLLAASDAPHEIKNEVYKLLQRKINGEELNQEPKIQVLNNYLDDQITEYNTYIKEVTQNEMLDATLLNNFFKTIMASAWV